MCEESGCKAELPTPVTSGPFMCPVCYGEGENADSDCESTVVNETCPVEYPVCALTVSTESADEKFTERGCFSRGWYEEAKDECEYYQNCKMAMCETSGCKAEFSASVTPAPFMCPVCYGEGENADSDCESTVVNKPCPEEYRVCALSVSTASADEKFTAIGCYYRTFYEETKDECEHDQNCKMVICETSGCKAEFFARERVQPLECPFCSGEGENAQQDCDNNIIYKPCKSTDGVCGVAMQGLRFQRGCTTEKRFNDAKKFCLKPDAAQPCVGAVCNESRCKAELPVSGSFP